MEKIRIRDRKNLDPGSATLVFILSLYSAVLDCCGCADRGREPGPPVAESDGPGEAGRRSDEPARRGRHHSHHAPDLGPAHQVTPHGQFVYHVTYPGRVYKVAQQNQRWASSHPLQQNKTKTIYHALNMGPIHSVEE
jgi:hypothetical protein